MGVKHNTDTSLISTDPWFSSYRERDRLLSPVTIKQTESQITHSLQSRGACYCFVSFSLEGEASF